MISTHAIYKKLVLKGMSDELAEAITEIMEEKQGDLATKDDINLLRIELKQIKSELKQDISNLRNDIKSDIILINSKLHLKLDNIKNNLIIWIIAVVIGIISLNLGILGVTISLWFK